MLVVLAPGCNIAGVSRTYSSNDQDTELRVSVPMHGTCGLLMALVRQVCKAPCDIDRMECESVWHTYDAEFELT